MTATGCRIHISGRCKAGVTIMDDIDAHVESWTAVLHVMVGTQRTQDFASDKPSENARLSVKLGVSPVNCITYMQRI